MAIVSCEEHPGGRGGSLGIDGVRSYSKQYIVITDDPTTTEVEVLAASGLPAIKAEHPADSKAVVVKRSPRPYGAGRLVWLVDIEYASRSGPAENLTFDRPWNRRPRLRWGSYAVQLPLEEDRDGDPILNSAGDRYDPPLIVEIHRPTLSVTRYERRYDINKALDYIDTVNELTLMIGGLVTRAEGALLTRFEGADVEVDGVDCWQVDYEIIFAPTFKRRVLDCGFYALDGTKKTKVTDGNNKDMTEPALLDGAGAVLGFGGTPVYLDFHVYRKVDFGPLGLP